MIEWIGFATSLLGIAGGAFIYHRRISRQHEASLERLSLQLQARLPAALRQSGAPLSGEQDGLSWRVTPVRLQRESLDAMGVRIAARPVPASILLSSAAARLDRIGLPELEQAAVLTAETRTLLRHFLQRGGQVRGGEVYMEEALEPGALDSADWQGAERLREVLDIARRLQLEPEQIADRLLSNLHDPDPAARHTCLRMLIAHCRERLDDRRLRALLTDPSPMVRLEAAAVLPDRDTLIALARQDAHIEARDHAIRRVDDDAFTAIALPVLHRAPVGAAEPGLLRLVADQIAARRLAALLPPMGEALEAAAEWPVEVTGEGSAPEIQLRLWAVIGMIRAWKALAEPGAESGYVLRRYEGHAHETVQIEVIHALGAVGTPLSLPWLQGMARGLLRDAAIRRAAAAAIAAIRARAAAESGRLSVAEGGGLSVAEGGGVSVAEGSGGAGGGRR